DAGFGRWAERSQGPQELAHRGRRRCRPPEGSTEKPEGDSEYGDAEALGLPRPSRYRRLDEAGEGLQEPAEPGSGSRRDYRQGPRGAEGPHELAVALPLPRHQDHGRGV